MGDALHTHDNWHWERTDKGGVRITDRSNLGNANAVHELDASQWASVVAHVGTQGENELTRARVVAIHEGKPDPGHERADELCLKLENQLVDSEFECAALQTELAAAKAALASAERERDGLADELTVAQIKAESANAEALARLNERAQRIEEHMLKLVSGPA